jgi:hypothetical protein
MLLIPEVLDSRAAGVGKCIALAFAAEPQGSTLLVGDERVPEYRLFEQFCSVGRFRFA